MAGCQTRLPWLLQSRMFARNFPSGRLLHKHYLPCLQHRACVTSLNRDPQNHCSVQSGWKISALKTNLWQPEHLNLRYLHSSFKLSQDKGEDQNKDSNINPSANSDGKKSDAINADGNKEQNVQEEKLSVFQRFKKTYKEHGKVLICVHLATSAVWFGSFFYAAKLGVDVIPFMEWVGLSEKIISPFRNSSLGDVALAYLMYKLATPARYTVTLTGTNLAVKYLRKRGVMKPIDKDSSLRSLARDSRKELKEKQAEVKNRTQQLEKKLREKHAEVKTKTDQFETRLKKKRAEVINKTQQFETNMKDRHLKMKDRFILFRSKLKDRRLKFLGSRKGQKSPRTKK